MTLLSALGLAGVLTAVIMTFVYADAADEIINGWGFGDDD